VKPEDRLLCMKIYLVTIVHGPRVLAQVKLVATKRFALASHARGSGDTHLPSQISASESAGSLSLYLSLQRQEGEGTSFLYLVVRVRVCLLWCTVGGVEAAPGRINLPHLYSHTDDDFHGGVSEVMATCIVRFIRSAAWSSRCSSDLARYVSWCVTGLCWQPGQGGFSGARMLVRRWWICRSFPTLSIGDGGSWSKTARRRLRVDVPQQHVPCCVQQAYSSIHKASLAMVLS
jgi:hypothetical protein